jgi:hypothetical protein
LAGGDNPLLKNNVNTQQKKRRLKEILREMVETITHKDYQRLVEK